MLVALQMTSPWVQSCEFVTKMRAALQMTSPWVQSYKFVTKNAGRFADDLAMGTGIQIGLINASKNYKRLKFAKSGNSQWEKKKQELGLSI